MTPGYGKPGGTVGQGPPTLEPVFKTLPQRLGGNNQTLDGVLSIALGIQMQLRRTGEYDQGDIVSVDYDTLFDLATGCEILARYLKEVGWRDDFDRPDQQL